MAEHNQAIELKLLMEAIYLRYSYDFRDYSQASLKRRVLLALRQMKCDGISQLQGRCFATPTITGRCANRWCRCCAPIRR